MADYIPILNSQLEPKAPVTSELMFQLRDNPIAITEGAVGAPRIQDAALGITSTTAGNTWVRNRTATSALGAVGTYVMLQYIGPDTLQPGDTAGGDDLRYSSAGGDTVVTVVPGTWRAMGVADAPAGGASATTLFLRVS